MVGNIKGFVRNVMRLQHLFFVLIILAISFSCNRLLAQEKQSQETDPAQLIRTPGKIFTTRTNPKALPLPKEEGVFHFAIYGDRTGGDPAGLKFLRQAVDDTNLMDPDLVMTVGDLIQGYNRPEEWMQQMREFKGIMSGLNMNWFPVAGNHDIYWDFRDRNRPNIHHEANFEKHFGPLWYAFEHKECGFVVLYSDEGDYETGRKGFRDPTLQNVSDKQMLFLDKAIEKLSDCKQVFVFMHHPRWLGGGYQGSNWPKVHKKLAAAGNVKAVFGGHIHHMTYKGPVDGIEYYTLATTGGHLAMDSSELGFLHHFNMVTVRENSFTVATLPVGSVIDPKTFKADFLDDVEVVRGMRPTRSGDRLGLDLNGGVSGAYEVSINNPGKSPIEVTLAPTLAGNWQALPDHQHVVVPPGKTTGMKFHFHKAAAAGVESGWSDFKLPTLKMNVDYLHSSARVRLAEVSVPVEMNLALPRDSFEKDLNRCLALRGVQSRGRRRQTRTTNDSVRIEPGEIDLPQGPFTIEAWVYPTDTDGSRGIIAKTQSSEYALFLHEGRAQFDIHIDGDYISPASDDSVPLNKWSHVAGVFDGKEARLYINGKKIKSLPAVGPRTVNRLPLFIGADPDRSGNPTREFAGRIDEVRVSQGVRYTDDFEAQSRFKSDGDTLLLLHLDQAFGPFLPSDTQQRVSGTKTGQAKIVSKSGDGK